jgi:hypothetical protein
MEFHYTDYLVRLTFNPMDIIVRFEHNKTYRSYEQTFFERDFPQASMMGGLDFLGKILATVFTAEKSADLSVENFTVTPSSLEFTAILNNPFFLKPISLTFQLPAIRKESANLDLQVLNRKMKDMSDGLEPRLQKLTEALESRLAIVDLLTSKMKEMEERADSHIVIPGCMFAISLTTPTLTLVRDRTSLPSGETFSIMNPGMKTTGNMSSHCNNPINWQQPFGNPQGGYTQNWDPHYNTYVVNQGIQSLANLKYLKKCTQLILSGLNEVRDYSPIGEMTQLTHLTIVSSRQFQWNNTANYINLGNNPVISDIKWIKNLKNLQSLTLLGCSSLSDITPLKELPNLRELDIRETAVRNTDFLINANLKITK